MVVRSLNEVTSSGSDEFDQWVELHRERLRRVLVARYGVHVGNNVCADAVAYAWEHWDRVRAMVNPTGYLYRVARSASRRHHRWRRAITLPPEPERVESRTEPRLPDALASLSPQQRVVVIMVHVHEWTYQEVADALGVSVGSVRNQLHRGLQRLRTFLEEDDQ